MDPQPVPFTGSMARTPVAPGREKELDEDDPYALVAVRYPVPDGVDGDRELARCLVEEYALTGWSAHRIRELFTQPAYAGAYTIVARRGMALIDQVLAETFGDSEPEAR